ncbi:MAG TPA: single-stranded DNA-binding protein [Ktedonobacteraceae bacterium]|nr:single-stranded DNA-binding protein [Ktedonobacteraceae bacterium]
MNKIMLIGNLGKDPEMSYTEGGVPFTRFSLAVRRIGKSSTGERQDETDWFNIVAWRQLAETCNNYLKKGQKVFIEGRLTQRKYTDKNGVERMAIEVTASDMEMLTPKGQGGQGSSSDTFLNNPDSLGELEDHPF